MSPVQRSIGEHGYLLVCVLVMGNASSIWGCCVLDTLESRDAHLPLLGWEIIRNPCLGRGIPMLQGVSLSWRVVRICVYINDTVYQSPLVTSVTFSCYAEVQVVNAKSVACVSVQITLIDACLISSAVRNGGPINVLGV